MKRAASQAVKCFSCGEESHTSSRSPVCPNHTQSKQEFISSVIGSDSTTFTRKLPVSRAVLPEYREKFMKKVISCCNGIRAIIFRCQLFVDTYLAHNKKNDFPSGVFTQQFWYSIEQLQSAITSPKAIVSVLQKLPRRQVLHTPILLLYSEERMLKYLTYKVQICSFFDKLVTERVTLLSLAAIPANFAKPLWYILSVYEQEHAEHAPSFIVSSVSKSWAWRGQRDVFTAASGLDIEEHQVRKCSNKEYYHMTGSTRSSARLEKRKTDSIKQVEIEIPTVKTGSPQQYKNHVKYILQHIKILFSFYVAGPAEDRFRLYQGRKRAADNMVNMLLDGTSKYNENLRAKKRAVAKKKKKNIRKIAETDEDEGQKEQDRNVKGTGKEKRVPLVVFGDGMFGKDSVKLKGLRCDVVGALFRALKRREAAGNLLVLMIDEFKTSKICCRCRSEEFHGLDDVPDHSILACKSYGILRNRDINACKNMMSIGTTIWNGNGRPEVLSTKTATATTSSTLTRNIAGTKPADFYR
ncbi:hypothetical protein BDF20DRAFT_838074 [Mycotypha africana]|uniref:uncharacterized protein n=1 Tax=Mycotypha africana TaxID=64632 RepID=UPI002301B326|nr:uncharacterized protein BDF20DRAFT_838074 [Mycotypha africana]KAI8971783.1 hypothetical protein BDF20DRAFT_838074 [Mycotypha africana]